MRLLAPSLVLVATVAAAEEPRPRFLLSIEKGERDEIVIQIRNAASQQLTLSARTYLVLAHPRQPEYSGEVKAVGLPGGSALFHLAGRAVSKVRVAPHSLQWAPDRSGLSPEQPLARVVPPGRYELRVQVEDAGASVWRSNIVTVTVKRGGALAF